MDNLYGQHLVNNLYGVATHHGLGIGGGRVIEYNSQRIRIISIEQFCQGEPFWIRSHPNRKFTKEESIERAQTRLGEEDYNVAFNNCEHFVNWCIEGHAFSAQVEVAKGGVKGSIGAPAVAKMAAVTTLQAGAAYTGGPAIMHGLATIGGSVVGGVGVLAAGSSIAASRAMHDHFAHDSEASYTENRAREAGRRGSNLGAVVGTTTSIVALNTMGTAGLYGGAALTTSLANIGGLVGGNMIAGVSLLVAAPVALTMGMGLAAYHLRQED